MNAMRSSTKPSTARPTVGNTSSSQNHANDPRRNNISYSNSNNTSNNYENSQHIDSVSGLGHRNIISVSNSYSKSNNNNTISAHSDDEITELINSTIQLASDLGNVAKENKKLISIVDNKELLTKLEEILEEIEEQNSKLILTIRTSKTVWNNLSHLLLSLQELNEYIAALNKKSLFLLSKNRIRKRILLFQQDLRARTTQLMTSISLELLSGNSNNDVVELVSTSELYNDAITYYYGLAGRPKNYVVAFGKFLVGANNDDTDAMVMAARCYINGYGTDPDYDKGDVLLT